MTVPGQLEHAAMRFTIENLQEIESRFPPCQSHVFVSIGNLRKE